MDYKKLIREIRDFPKKGVGFKDITPVLENAAAFKQIIDDLAEPYLNQKIDKVVGIDARGFLLASAVAYKLGAGVAIVRKKGKLPHKTIAEAYELEYGTNEIEIHADAIKPGEKVVIVDDVLATGGTVEVTVRLIERLEGDICGISFLIELGFLKGREKIKGYSVYSLVNY